MNEKLMDCSVNGVVIKLKRERKAVSGIRSIHKIGFYFIKAEKKAEICKFVGNYPIEMEK